MTTPAVVLGLGIGDSLGMPFEVHGDTIHPNLETWDGSFQPGTHHKLPAGCWTDDTEMAVALAESLIAQKGYDPADAAARYLAWSQATPHGMGGTTRRAMAALASGKSWQESGVEFDDPVKVGNGTAMRVAPLGVAHPHIPSCVVACRQDAAITHAHLEATAASYAVALSVSALSNHHVQTDGSGLLLIAQAASRWNLSQTKLSEALEHARKLFDRCVEPAQAIATLGRHGNAIETVASALYCAAYHINDFRAGVCAAVRGGGDTDTRGAITGALLGAYLGLEGIPEEYMSGVAQSAYLQELDRKLVELRNVKT